MEKVGRLVPVNPHATEVVPKKVVERVARQEAQAVGNPVGLAGGIKIIWLRALAEVANGLCTLVVGPGPDTKCNAI